MCPQLHVEERYLIRELYGRYAWAVATADLEGFASLFSSNGVIHDVGAGERGVGSSGARAWLAAWSARAASPGRQHWVGAVLLDGCGRDATGRCYGMATHRYANGAVMVTHLGYYLDRMSKVDGRWLFNERIIRRWEGPMLETLPPLVAGPAGGTPKRVESDGPGPRIEDVCGWAVTRETSGSEVAGTQDATARDSGQVMDAAKTRCTVELTPTAGPPESEVAYTSDHSPITLRERLEVDHLFAEFSQALQSTDERSIARLFIERGRLEYENSCYEGRDELTACARERQRDPVARDLRYWFTQTVLSRRRDVIAARSFVMGTHAYRTGSAAIVFLGCSHDTFVATPAGLRFAQRRIHAWDRTMLERFPSPDVSAGTIVTACVC